MLSLVAKHGKAQHTIPRIRVLNHAEPDEVVNTWFEARVEWHVPFDNANNGTPGYHNDIGFHHDDCA